jgi:hypothetical protein
MARRLAVNAHRQVAGRGVKLVVVADVEHHPIQREDALDQPRQVADQAGGVLVQHHLLREFVSRSTSSRRCSAWIAWPRARSATGPPPRNWQKRDHGHPRLNAHNPQRMNGGRKK